MNHPPLTVPHCMCTSHAVTAASFPLPPSTAKPPQPINPHSKDYYHLESNRALLNPPTGGNLSEVRGNFTAPLSGPEECLTKRLSSFGERTDRIVDNKGTHFVLGFDDPVATSEKVCLVQTLTACTSYRLTNSPGWTVW